MKIINKFKSHSAKLEVSNALRNWKFRSITISPLAMK